MALFTSGERKNGYTSAKFNLPELSTFDKKVRRLEVLLLENPAGFFESHIKSYLGTTSEEVHQVLNTLQAQQLNGFWVHPHFYFNIRHDGADLYNCAKPVETSIAQIITAIANDPMIPVHSLMRMAKLYHPNDLIRALKLQTSFEVHKETQHIASCFLYRHFNIKNVVHKL